MPYWTQFRSFLSNSVLISLKELCIHSEYTFQFHYEVLKVVFCNFWSIQNMLKLDLQHNLDNFGFLLNWSQALRSEIQFQSAGKLFHLEFHNSLTELPCNRGWPPIDYKPDVINYRIGRAIWKILNRLRSRQVGRWRDKTINISFPINYLKYLCHNNFSN